MIKLWGLEIRFPKITTRAMIAFIVIAGYVLAVGTIVLIEIPKDQKDILDKAMVGLGTLAGAVVNGLFNSNKEKDEGPLSFKNYYKN